MRFKIIDYDFSIKSQRMKARKDFLKFIEDEGSETELIILDTIIEVQELIESQDESNYKYDDFMKFLNTLNCSIC